MSKFILIKNIKVINANANSGFTWGFPSPTHFLGFINALRLKLTPSLLGHDDKTQFQHIKLLGCGIFNHKHQIHTYQNIIDKEKGYCDDLRFSQLRGTSYMEFQDKRTKTPPVMEEAKMNMTVSLLIEYEGLISNNTEESFKSLIQNTCYTMRLAGGSILSVDKIKLYNIDEDNDKNIYALKRELLPSFVLIDRSDNLKKYVEELKTIDPKKEFYDAWLDCFTLKQKPRPCYDLIYKEIKNSPNSKILKLWEEHLEVPFSKESIPNDIINFLTNLESNEETNKQIQNYLYPTEDSPANWEIQPKPLKGYIVPIMTGYKALSEVMENSKVSNTRDNTTDIRFVEPIHSIAEWKSTHRLHSLSDINETLWDYQYDDEWYLCKNLSNNTSEDYEESWDD